MPELVTNYLICTEHFLWAEDPDRECPECILTKLKLRVDKLMDVLEAGFTIEAACLPWLSDAHELKAIPISSKLLRELRTALRASQE